MPKNSKLKIFLEEILSSSISKKSLYFDVGIIILITISLVIYVFEISNSNVETKRIMHTIEIVILSFFLVEFVARFYLASDKKKFFLSAYTWIDMLAIFPFLLGLSLEHVGTFRLFKVFRTLRFLRFSSKYFSEHRFASYGVEKLLAMRILLTVFMLVFVSSALVFQFEAPHNSGINNFGDAIYFIIISSTTVGFGDIYPVTAAGRVLTLITTVSFLLVIPAHITSILKYFSRSKDGFKPIICASCDETPHALDSFYCRKCGEKLVNSENSKL